MTKPMTKSQLVTAVAEEMHGEKKTAQAALDALSGIITRTVADGGVVILPNVGKLYCRERPARPGRNPATGEQSHKDADSHVKVSVAKALKDGANG